MSEELKRSLFEVWLVEQGYSNHQCRRKPESGYEDDHVDDLWDGFCVGISAQSAAQSSGEAVRLQHVAVCDEGELRWMTGIKPRDCELYAVKDDARIPLVLYTAPPAAPAETKAGTVLPDGSAFFTASFPLPKDHWLYAPSGEWDVERDCSAELPAPILNHAEHRNAVISAIRYAIRGATMRGTDMDFDPDALVQNAVVALCGFYGPVTSNDAPAPVSDADKRDAERYRRFRLWHPRLQTSYWTGQYWEPIYADGMDARVDALEIHNQPTPHTEQRAATGES